MNHRAVASRLLVFVLALVVVTACTTADRGEGASSGSVDASPGTSTTEAGEPLTWRPCGREVDCSHLPVPLDWDDPDGETISLALIRRPANDQRHRLGTIVTNPGGPGGSGLTMLRTSPVFDDTITDRFDIVSFDPRGVGETAPLQCGATVPTFLAHDPSPDDDDERRSLDDAARALADECAAKDARLLPHVGTESVARDLEAIRVALGQGDLNFFGFSYGTLIGLLYADRFPDQVRTMVLDGVIDPRDDFTDFLRGQARAIEAALERIAAACAARSECPVDDFDATFDRVAAAVDAKVMRVETAGSISRSFGPAELAAATIYATYGPDYQRTYLKALAAADKGDGGPLLDLSDLYRAFGGFALYTAVECIDSPRPEGAEAFDAFTAELAGISARLGPAVGNELRACAHWPVAPTRHPKPVRAKGSAPILVVGNTGDAATPFVQAEAVAGELSTGVLVTYEGEGHTSYGKSDCVDGIITRYVVDGEVPESDVTCS